MSLRGRNEKIILDYLYKHGEVFDAEAGAVAVLVEATGLDNEHQQVNGTLITLDRKGYIERLRADDGRFIVGIGITDTGKMAIKDVYLFGRMVPTNHAPPAEQDTIVTVDGEPVPVDEVDAFLRMLDKPEPQEPDYDALARSLLAQVLEQAANPPLVKEDQGLRELADSLAREVTRLEQKVGTLREERNFARNEAAQAKADNIDLGKQVVRLERELQAMTERHNLACEQRNALEQKVRSSIGTGTTLKPEHKAALQKMMRELPRG